jgi:carboxypeptidase C (cathepsin A)
LPAAAQKIYSVSPFAPPIRYIVFIMKFSSLARALKRVAPFFAFVCVVTLPCLFATAQSDTDAPPPHAAAPPAAKPAADRATDKVADAHPLPPLPPDAHTQQSITLDGKKLAYTVTVGTLIARDAEGKAAGQIVYTAYTVDGPNRPVTFAFNGGPGAASVYLNFGAIGPKHLNAGNEGDSPSDPPTLVDNAGTWLDFTDLVFIDPIGTGFSRSLVDADQTRKLFWTTEPDIEYLSRAVYDWLVKNDRLESRKYLVGESYGGFRGPRITYFLQSQLGVALAASLARHPAVDYRRHPRAQRPADA